MDHSSFMLLFLSRYNEKSKKMNYMFKDGDKSYTYIGEQTNDAPTQCLLEAAFREGRPIKKILCIISRDVYEYDKNAENTKNIKMSTYEYYKNMVEQYFKEEKREYPEPEICPVYYDFAIGQNEELNNCDTDKIVVRIYKQIISLLGSQGNQHPVSVYIDYTGGFRDISFLMTTIIRYLEFSNVQCSKIVYSAKDKGKDNEPCPILEIRYIYDMFQVINGVSEFVSTGNARQLKQLYEKMQEDSSESSQKINNALESILQFSDVLSLCQTDKIDDKIKSIIQNINAIKEDRTSANETKNEGYYQEVFRTLIPLIEEKMFFGANSDDPDKVSYQELIQWCLDNRMIQQAVTIYIEKISKYYGGRLNMQKVYDTYNVEEGYRSFAHFYQNISDYVLHQQKDYQRMREKLKNIYDQASQGQENSDQKLQNNFIRILEKNDFGLPFVRLKNIIIKKFIKGKSVDIYGEHISQRSFVNFIQFLNPEKEEEKGNSNKYLHYFLYNDEYNFKIMKRHNTHGKKYTNRKKIEALKKLEKDHPDDADVRQIILAIKYYMTVKIIRNRINHASDEVKDEEDVNEVKNYLNQTHSGIRIGEDYESIQQLIQNAIDLSQKEGTEK